MTRRSRALVLTAVLTALVVVPVGAYLKLGTRVGTRTESLRWRTFPIRYFITNAGVFWRNRAAVPGCGDACLQHLARSREHGNVIDVRWLRAGAAVCRGWRQRDRLSQSARPDRTLAATTFTVDTTDGRILESDIYFNTIFPWSTSDGGTADRYDVESIALHEIGHLLGLSHSALGETELIGGSRRVIAAQSVMFPIAFSRREHRRSLAQGRRHRRHFRHLRHGHVLRASSAASAVASPRAAAAFRARTSWRSIRRRGSSSAASTLNEAGDFVIAGLEPGPQILRAEPLDDGDVTSFFDDDFDVDLDFRVTFYDRIVAVPRGGGARDIEIKVTAK